jgi:hypothetical protein
MNTRDQLQYPTALSQGNAPTVLIKTVGFVGNATGPYSLEKIEIFVPCPQYRINSLV